MYCMKCKRESYGRENKCLRCGGPLIDKNKLGNTSTSNSSFVSDDRDIIDTAVEINNSSDSYSGDGGDFGGGGSSGEW